MNDAPKPASDSTSDDEAVIREVLSGNTNAFRILEQRYRRIVSFLIRKVIRNREDVEDLTQETFTKAFAALKTFQFEYPFSRWLYKIASNSCIDHLRRRRFTVVSIDEPYPGRDGGDVFMDIPDQAQTPDVSLLANERAAMLRTALATLPEKYRLVIRLRHEEELEYQEISDQLQLPLGTVKAHLFRARKLLYKRMLIHGSHFEEYMPDESNE